MNLVLPSTVEDINRLQQNYEMTTSKDVLGYNKGFENILVEKRYKREVSLPDGIKNWDIDNIQSYLNFEDEGFKAIESSEVVQVVPEEENFRLRCDSYSSMTSASMDDRNSMFFQGMGVKTINTICVDSGSTCISAAPSYIPSPDSIFRTMDPEETYQNLEVFLQQVPEVTENLPSPLSVSGSESSFEMPVLHGNYFLPTCTTQDSLSEAPRGTKRPASTSSDVDIFGLRTSKQQCPSPSPVQFNEVRRKNNIASKNCRKTRKEKQKEMEVRVSELEKEKDALRVEVQVLEELIQAHKMQLYAILKKR